MSDDTANPGNEESRMATGRSPLVDDQGGPGANPIDQSPLDVVESRVLTMSRGQSAPACVAAIFKGFDQIRRDVAVRVAGQAGIFIGFDPIDLLLDTTPPSGTVLLVGSVLDRPTPKRHRVRYTAYVVLDAPYAGAAGLHLLVVRAIGMTLTPGAPAARSSRAGAPS
jgi:hypothetical protein